jgi:uncharacterized protein YceK
MRRLALVLTFVVLCGCSTSTKFNDPSTGGKGRIAGSNILIAPQASGKVVGLCPRCAVDGPTPAQLYVASKWESVNFITGNGAIIKTLKCPRGHTFKTEIKIINGVKYKLEPTPED